MDFLIKHWKPALAAALLLALIGAWQADRARQYTRGQTDKAAEISLALAEAAKKQAEQARQASADYQAEKAERETKERIRYVQVQKIVERPVYHRDCFDADGLRQLNDAIGG